MRKFIEVLHCDCCNCEVNETSAIIIKGNGDTLDICETCMDILDLIIFNRGDKKGEKR